MELRHLEYFIAVAEEKSFSNAARRLHMAQPPLSMQIKSLEEELGAKLFTRLSRGVELTSIGKIFLQDARCVLKKSDDAKKNIRKAAEGTIGSLSIGVLPTLVNDQLAGFLREFRRRHPKVVLDLHELHTPDIVHELLEDQIDMGFARAPINEPELEQYFISDEPMVLAVPSNDPLARLKRVDWKLLDGYPLVLLDNPFAANFNHQFLSAYQEAGVSPMVAQYAHSMHMCMWLVSAGFGVAPAPHALRYIIRPNLSFCDLSPNPPILKTVLVWKKTKRSPALQNMLQIINPEISIY